MGLCNRKCALGATFSFSTLLIVLGLLLALLWGSLFNTILSKELTLTNTSKSYDLWKETPIPMYLSVYLFNWTNANEVLQKKWTVKPEMQECGPYVFSEHHIRVNLTWNDNGTVTYQQRRIWHFIPELSNGSLNDKITNLNPIVATAGNKIKVLPGWIRSLVNIALKGLEGNLVVTKTADEWLFKGYEDPILNILAKLKIKNLKLPFTKFGWFYMRNDSNTYDGTYTMYTGKNDIELVGVMDLWNGQPHTDDYEGYCAYVNGTSGELWPPVTDYKTVSIFSSDICSSLAIEYKEDALVRGVHGKKFVGTDFAFDNGTKYPEQACFHGADVVASGIRDITKCRFGAPAFVSYPHFYLADASYRNTINGMHPNKTKHEMYVSLEPKTGIPIDVRAQMQINLFINTIPSMSMFANIKPTYMPMMWFSQTATLTEEFAIMVRVTVILSKVGVYVGWSAFGVGVLLALAGIYLICRKDWKDKEAVHLLENDEQQ